MRFAGARTAGGRVLQASASATSICVSAQQNRGKDELLKLIRENLPAGGRRRSRLPNADHEARHRRPAQHRQEHLHQLPGPGASAPSSARSPAPPATASTSASSATARRFIAIDTAGVRSKGNIKTDVEFYSLARAERSHPPGRRGAAFLRSAEYESAMVDKQLAGYVLEQYKPAIFVVNKWDLMPDLATGEFGDYLRKAFPASISCRSRSSRPRTARMCRRC